MKILKKILRFIALFVEGNSWVKGLKKIGERRLMSEDKENIESEEKEVSEDKSKLDKEIVLSLKGLDKPIDEKYKKVIEERADEFSAFVMAWRIDDMYECMSWKMTLEGLATVITHLLKEHPEMIPLVYMGLAAEQGEERQDFSEEAEQLKMSERKTDEDKENSFIV